MVTNKKESPLNVISLTYQRLDSLMLLSKVPISFAYLRASCFLSTFISMGKTFALQYSAHMPPAAVAAVNLGQLPCLFQ